MKKKEYWEDHLINKDAWYSAQQIDEQKLLPMLSSLFVVKNYINKGLLRGITVGKGNIKRYKVKGEWLIEFLAKWESGDFLG